MAFKCKQTAADPAGRSGLRGDLAYLSRWAGILYKSCAQGGMIETNEELLRLIGGNDVSCRCFRWHQRLFLHK